MAHSHLTVLKDSELAGWFLWTRLCTKCESTACSKAVSGGTSHCHLPAGEKGSTGFRGAPGLPGKNGVPGLPGDHGDTGLMGFPGSRGFPGPRGSKGITGFQGQPGDQVIKALVKCPGLCSYLLPRGRYFCCTHPLDVPPGERPSGSQEG